MERWKDSSTLDSGCRRPQTTDDYESFVYAGHTQRSGWRMGELRMISLSVGSGFNVFQRSMYFRSRQAMPENRRPGERTGRASKCSTSFAHFQTLLSLRYG